MEHCAAAGLDQSQLKKPWFWRINVLSFTSLPLLLLNGSRHCSAVQFRAPEISLVTPNQN